MNKRDALKEKQEICCKWRGAPRGTNFAIRISPDDRIARRRSECNHGATTGANVIYTMDASRVMRLGIESKMLSECDIGVFASRASLLSSRVRKITNASPLCGAANFARRNELGARSSMRRDSRAALRLANVINASEESGM